MELVTAIKKQISVLELNCKSFQKNFKRSFPEINTPVRRMISIEVKKLTVLKHSEKTQRNFRKNNNVINVFAVLKA